MSLCTICGNKRCPKATAHWQECTASNATGQPGSVFAGVSRSRGLYSVARWHGGSWPDEFVNVGVLLMSAGEVQFKHVLTACKINRVFCSNLRDEILGNTLSDVCTAIAQRSKDENSFAEALADYNHSLRFSISRPMVVFDELRSEVEDLFQEVVTP